MSAQLKLDLIQQVQKLIGKAEIPMLKRINKLLDSNDLNEASNNTVDKMMQKAKIQPGCDDIVRKVILFFKRVRTPNDYLFQLKSAKKVGGGDICITFDNTEVLGESIEIFVNKGKYSSCQYTGHFAVCAEDDVLWIGNIDDRISFLQEIEEYLKNIEKEFKNFSY